MSDGQAESEDMGLSAFTAEQRQHLAAFAKLYLATDPLGEPTTVHERRAFARQIIRSVEQ